MKERFGEDNPAHVLTNDNVKEIQVTTGSNREVGKMYEGSHETIRLIKKGRHVSWMAVLKMRKLRGQNVKICL